MDVQKNQIIGELVAKDYRSAGIFKKYGIDFCCQGNRTINDACEAHKVDTSVVLAELNSMGSATSSTNSTSATGIDFQSWPLDLLADYIEKTHHRYVQDKSLEIIQYLAKICEVHGNNHPELFKIKELFTKVVENLLMHMQKEEMVLFPFIRKMEQTKRSGQFLERPSFGSIKNPIATMEDEHLAEGDRYREIDNLSNHYTVPKDGCSTYQVTYTMLKEFEEDLHMHIHLENNILFPKSILLEEQLM